jgi:hypothetical protein
MIDQVKFADIVKNSCKSDKITDVIMRRKMFALIVDKGDDVRMIRIRIRSSTCWAEILIVMVKLLHSDKRGQTLQLHLNY